MNLLPTLLLVSVEVILAINDEPPPRSYNVLILSPISSPSHHSLLMPIAAALADRGHQITMLTNYDAIPTRKNITTLTHGLPYAKVDHIDLFNVGRNPLAILKVFPEILSNMSRDLYNTPVVADLYRRRNEFDVVFIDFFWNEMTFPFAVGKPLITMSVCCNDHTHSFSFGNMFNPAYISHSFYHFGTSLSFLERMENFIFFVGIIILRYWVTIAPVQYQISKQFPDIPSLAEIELNQSLAFSNTHFSLNSPPERLLPGQIEVAGIQCKESKPLTKEFADFVSSDTPVVLMAMGNSMSEKHMSESHRNMFLSAFSKLPCKVIWKFDGPLENVPPNVMIKSWVPQQDLLAHPNVKAFISHGGTLGMLEAVYHGTPSIMLPVYADHPKNAMRVQTMGTGLALSWDTVSEEQITESVMRVIEEPQFQEKVSEMSRAFRDQPETPVERMVYWTEYVVQHGGAPHLQSPRTKLYLFQHLNLDVFALCCLLLYLLFKINVFVFQRLVKIMKISRDKRDRKRSKKIK